MKQSTEKRACQGLSKSALIALFMQACLSVGTVMADAPTPSPLLSEGSSVDWWFAFKFNASTEPLPDGEPKSCAFGGTPQDYKYASLGYAVASSDNASLQQSEGLIGSSSNDPLGATFGSVYNGDFYYVVWNDQFYEHPKISGCGTSCSAPWGHSKGLLAWNDTGEGLVLQVTTPSWPASGSAKSPRTGDGNTLGCVSDDDIEVSQHFFSLKLTKDDVVAVLKALANASVVTDPNNSQLVHSGGPSDIQDLVEGLGTKSGSTTVLTSTLSSGVELIAKPSALQVPPWQMVSAELGGVPLRVASWWANPEIPSTDSSGAPGCWADSLSSPGEVQIATTGTWNEKSIGLRGGVGADFNHAKIGVTVSGDTPYVIFGDMNQQGSLSPPECSSSQNGRGGLFFAVKDQDLLNSVSGLLMGKTAPDQ